MKPEINTDTIETRRLWHRCLAGDIITKRDVFDFARVPTREDAPIVDSSWDFEDFDDEDDFTADDDGDDCGMFPEDGAWVCMQIGSEPCECCPNRALVGTAIDDSENSSNYSNPGE